MQKIMNNPEFGCRMSRLMLVMLLTLTMHTLAGCGGGGSVDGDEEVPNCPDGYFWFNGDCRPDINNDGDNPPVDGDPDDIPIDGDEVDDIEPDIDGDIPTDGDEVEIEPDLDEEKDIPVTEDGDLDDVEPERKIEWEELDDEVPECIPGDPSMSCPQGYYCGDDLYCHPLEIEIEEEIEWDSLYCNGGSLVCTEHSDCEGPVACNPISGCCDPDYHHPCVPYSDDCDEIYGTYCSASAGNTCAFDCIEDNDCPISGDCCQEEYGKCQPDWWCADPPDGDEEIEIPPCQNCADCVASHGTEYYCNIDVSDCVLKPVVNGCCENDDCTAEANGSCNLSNGLCEYYQDPPNRGSISGLVYIASEMMEYNITVAIFVENLNGQEVAAVTGLVPLFAGDKHAVSYTLDRLTEGTYFVYLEVEGTPLTRINYPFNPIVVNFSNVETTIVEDIDFYMFLSDPRLANIDGTMEFGDSYQYSNSQVVIYKIDPDSGLPVEYNIEYSTNDKSIIENYGFTNIYNGNYLLVASVVHDEKIVKDYYSKTIRIDLDETPEQLVEDIDFYFGVAHSGLGTINGTVHYADYFADSEISIEIFNEYEYPYVVGEGILNSAKSSASVDYQLANIEDGTYWVRGKIQIGDDTVYSAPIMDSVDITADASTVINDIDIFFDLPEDSYCSMSGQIQFDDDMDTAEFEVSVYRDLAFTNLVESYGVYGVDIVSNTADYFAGKLSPGTYYLQVTATVDESVETTQDTVPKILSFTVGQQDLTGLSFDFRD